MHKDAKLVELESKPIARLLAQYSLPAIVGMAAMSVYNLVDAMYIGQCCGPYAIAAMALAFPITNLMVAVGSMIGLGCSSLASISLGQQDFDINNGWIWTLMHTICQNKLKMYQRLKCKS